jgi:hypothetical protein
LHCHSLPAPTTASWRQAASSSFSLPGPSVSPTPYADMPLHAGSPSVTYQSSIPSMYDVTEDGNIPLLNCPSSQARLHIPAQLDEEDDSTPIADDKSESNVRYGHIPQRWYKTLKKSRASRLSFLPIPSFFLTCT